VRAGSVRSRGVIVRRAAPGVSDGMDAFSGRVAVITGGAGGIGMAMARAFAGRGAKLVLADVDDAALARAAETLRADGAAVHTVRTDVGDRAAVEALADETFRHFGAAHIVCNNAGIALFGEIASATHKDWEYTMRVNFWGVVHGVEAFVPRLIAQKAGGHVVNTASMAGLVGMQWLGVYCASKFAVVGLSEALHRELAPHDVGVSVLCPMIVDTDINANSLRQRPAALRNPGHTDAPPDIEAGTMVGSVIPTAEVARRVVRAVERRDLYVLTHPEQRDILRRRARRQDQMFEPGTW
jgi:NAD(P)-dependent dehydrogenase (short-subunit alcohol dehydrogenase family)